MSEGIREASFKLPKWGSIVNGRRRVPAPVLRLEELGEQGQKAWLDGHDVPQVHHDQELPPLCGTVCAFSVNLVEA